MVINEVLPRSVKADARLCQVYGGRSVLELGLSRKDRYLTTAAAEGGGVSVSHLESNIVRRPTLKSPNNNNRYNFPSYINIVIARMATRYILIK